MTVKTKFLAEDHVKGVYLVVWIYLFFIFCIASVVQYGCYGVGGDVGCVVDD